MLKGFKDFLLRGNVVDLAVAVVIGAAFGGVVSAFAQDFIGGIVGAVGGSPDFGKAGFRVNGSPIILGSTITAMVNFLIVAAVVYFFVLTPREQAHGAAQARRGDRGAGTERGHRAAARDPRPAPGTA
jgi:large conductance mechanosensitive channel